MRLFVGKYFIEVLSQSNKNRFRAMKNYVDCIKYPVRYECGYRAWQDVREIIIGPAQLIMPDCELSGSPPTKTSSIFNFGMLVPTIFAKIFF